MRLPPPLTTIPMTIPARLMLMPEINNGNNDGSSVAPELTPNSDNNESTSTTSANNEVMKSPHLSCSATKPNHLNLLRRLF